jgi:uncharacterized delta-60 repeat protein
MRPPFWQRLRQTAARLTGRPTTAGTPPRRRPEVVRLEDRLTPAGAFAAVWQPDGKLLLVTATGGGNPDIAVARYDASGAPDTSFNGSGSAVVAFDLGGSNADQPRAVVVQPDGKVLVAGTAATASGTDFALARLNPDGSPDASFNGTGKKTLAFDLGGTRDDAANAVALLPDGRIVVAGTAATVVGGTDVVVARLKADGATDTSFGGAGFKTVAFDVGGSKDDDARALVVQPDGKVLVAGAAATASGTDFALARLNPDGSPDASFNGTGKKTLAFDLGGTRDDAANALALQPDGRILAAGVAATAAGTDFALARLKPDGTLDASFNGSGLRTVAVDAGGSKDDAANALALQPDGRILAAGVAATAAGTDFALARLNPDGSPDTSFNGSGFETVHFNLVPSPIKNEARALAPQADGKILVAGTFDSNPAVARLNGDGSLDTLLIRSVVYGVSPPDPPPPQQELSGAPPPPGPDVRPIPPHGKHRRRKHRPTRHHRRAAARKRAPASVARQAPSGPAVTLPAARTASADG